MKNLHKNIGVFASSLLVTASAVYVYSPVIGSHADSSATADINLSVGEVMSLTLDTNSLDLNTTINSFVSGVINATASTNSQYGYTLTLEDVDANTNLVHTNENIEATVASNFSGSKTSSEMEDNTWGFSLNATDFYKVPANGSPVALKRTTTAMTTASETTPVTFGAKVGNITSGTYTDSVLFTMYVNGQDGKPTDPTGQTTPVDPSEPGTDPSGTTNDSTTLQGFSCDRDLPNVYDHKILTDVRDGETYTVAKFDDNQCWMTENLRLVGPVTLTSANSDTDNRSMELPESNWDKANTDNDMYDRYNNAYIYDTNIREYGVYYNFYAATLGEIALGSNESPVTSSICPKGWRLPTRDDVHVLQSGNSTKYLSEPYNFVLSGYMLPNRTTPTDQNKNGHYWTSTNVRPESNWAQDRWHIQIFKTGEIDGDSAYSRDDGLTIRCIAR